ncbi:MAG TPA: BatD family protein [Thermoanaerobaculia bacterium]|nr:BatD family protein [Thermoanaerobaculia bacterium]
MRRVSLLLILLAAARAFSNDLSVDRRSVRQGDFVTITVSLEGEFAKLGDVYVPTRNLAITGSPAVSSEFSYINGAMTRRKVFRFRARATGPGPATAGPVELLVRGQRATLQPVTLQVLPDRAAASNDPMIVLQELMASERDPFFIVVEADKQSAYVGEQVVVTWWLYNAANIHQWQIGSIPKLNDFWVEELDVRSSQPSPVSVGTYSMQKMPIRRVALFPLRSGRLEIGPMEIEGALVRRSARSVFGMFEGSLAELTYASATVAVQAREIPPGPAVAAVGDLMLRCTTPVQKNGGPVVVDAVLSGRGNVRAAGAPSFRTAPAAAVQVIDSGVSMLKTESAPAMTRRWKFVMFPRRSGRMTVPAMELAVFSPAAGRRQTLRCEARTLEVIAATGEAAAGGGALADRSIRSPLLRLSLPVAMAAIVGVVIWFAVWPWWRKRRAVRTELGELTADPAPAAIRDAVHHRLEQRGLSPAVLLREASERGEAYRSLRSLLDALERDRIALERRDREIRRRLRDLLVA